MVITVGFEKAAGWATVRSPINSGSTPDPTSFMLSLPPNEGRGIRRVVWESPRVHGALTRYLHEVNGCSNVVIFLSRCHSFAWKG